MGTRIVWRSLGAKVVFRILRLIATSALSILVFLITHIAASCHIFFFFYERSHVIRSFAVVYYFIKSSVHEPYTLALTISFFTLCFSHTVKVESVHSQRWLPLSHATML